jgi:hypothetical protein
MRAATWRKEVLVFLSATLFCGFAAAAIEELSLAGSKSELSAA